MDNKYALTFVYKKKMEKQMQELKKSVEKEKKELLKQGEKIGEEKGAKKARQGDRTQSSTTR